MYTNSECRNFSHTLCVYWMWLQRVGIALHIQIYGSALVETCDNRPMALLEDVDEIESHIHRQLIKSRLLGKSLHVISPYFIILFINLMIIRMILKTCARGE